MMHPAVFPRWASWPCSAFRLRSGRPRLRSGDGRPRSRLRLAASSPGSATFLALAHSSAVLQARQRSWRRRGTPVPRSARLRPGWPSSAGIRLRAAVRGPRADACRLAGTRVRAQGDPGEPAAAGFPRAQPPLRRGPGPGAGAGTADLRHAESSRTNGSAPSRGTARLDCRAYSTKLVRSITQLGAESTGPRRC